MSMTDAPYRVLNRDAIKYIAMFTMLLNHIAHVFLDTGTVLFSVFTAAGYFTAPVMVYFMVEGYGYTRSKKKYFLRLLLFAALSQFPYYFAFSPFGMWMYNLNMIVTLCLCFGVIRVTKTVQNRPLRVFLVVLLVFASLFCDWGLLAPVYTLLFLWAEGSRKKTGIAYAIAAGIFAAMLLARGMAQGLTGLDLVPELLYASGIAAAGVCITFFYNGKRMERGRTFSKWFFYAFYPAHLLALGVIYRLLYPSVPLF